MCSTFIHRCILCFGFFLFFFFNDTATTEIYTLSLHDALPICTLGLRVVSSIVWPCTSRISFSTLCRARCGSDRKSTRLNSSHMSISYAVFCLKKKKKKNNTQNQDTKDKSTNTHITQLKSSTSN